MGAENVNEEIDAEIVDAEPSYSTPRPQPPVAGLTGARLPAVPRPLNRRLSPKDRRFLVAYMDTGNVRVAMAIADPSTPDHLLSTRGMAALKRLDVALDFVMEHNGLSDVCLVNKLMEGLEAKETKFATFKGEIGDTMDVVDYATRVRYLELAARAKGWFVKKPAEREDEGGGKDDRVSVIINIGDNRQVQVGNGD